MTVVVASADVAVNDDDSLSCAEEWEMRSILLELEALMIIVGSQEMALQVKRGV